MRILLANKFLYRKGGAEVSLFETAELLRRKGHEVVFFAMQHPDNIPSAEGAFFVSQVDYERDGLKDALRTSARLLYSFEAKRNIARLIESNRPDLAHLNNIYHQLSPSIIHALRAAGIPMVMTLRDYKLVCGSYSMLANGSVCEACRGGRYYHCVLKKCVKDSRAKSLLTTIEMYLHHRVLHIYDAIDLFIAPSQFLKQKVEEMGFQGRIVVLPNLVRTQAVSPSFAWEQPTLVYFGRLSKEKGLLTLLEAVKELPEICLQIIGTGPLRPVLEEAIGSQQIQNVQLLGPLSGEVLTRTVSRSMFTVLPSEWYENNPRAILESFALGKPVVATRIGGIPELVKDGQTGRLCEPRNPADLRTKIQELARHPEDIRRMGHTARRFVEEELNEERHYDQLMAIYTSVMNGSLRRPLTREPVELVT